MHLDTGVRGEDFAKKTIEEITNLRSSKVFGFETKYLPHHHLSKSGVDMDLEDYIALIRDIGFDKFITLHRNNYLLRAISGQIGLHTKKWHSASSVETPTKIKLDVNAVGANPTNLLDLFNIMDEGAIRLRQVLERDDVLNLIYEEDILSGPSVAYGKICEFIGIKNEHPPVSLKRTNPFEYNEMISNIDEVYGLLKDTKYKWMLNA